MAVIIGKVVEMKTNLPKQSSMKTYEVNKWQSEQEHCIYQVHEKFSNFGRCADSQMQHAIKFLISTPNQLQVKSNINNLRNVIISSNKDKRNTTKSHKPTP